LKNILIVAVVGAVVCACAPTIPDSAAGVGFENYADYQRRQAVLARPQTSSVLPPANAVSSEPLPSSTGATTAQIPVTDAAAVAAETQAALRRTAANSGQLPLDASPSNPAPLQLNNPGISDENSFEAVGARRSIESDAERIARNRAQYEVVAPTALPARSGTSGPNLVEYALKTSNSRGQSLYQRSVFNTRAKTERNCASYPSPDLAQSEFLSTGGPQRDRKGLDPDGDGFACAWDPAPFRKAAGN